MNELPAGTVTFLFTDIEGSTQLWEQHSPSMHAALARHDSLLRQAIERHHGQVFKTVGDAFYAVFPRAPEAVQAAIAAQRALQVELPQIRVRMAVHTGEAESREGDYFGPALNRVARLLVAGHGGQVLLSGATVEQIRPSLPGDVGLRSLGEHRLRDLADREAIYQLLPPGLKSEFPPLNTLDVAFRRGLMRAASVAAIVLVAMGALAAAAVYQAREARRQQQRAEQQAEGRRRDLYVQSMNVAQQAVDQGNRGRAWDLIQQQTPGRGQTDLRGWEWRYLWGRCQSDAFLTVPDTQPDGGVAFSPDGRTLAVMGKDRTVRLWKLAPGVSRQAPVALQGKPALLPTTADQTGVLAFSPDGRVLAAGGWENAVHLWDVATHRPSGPPLALDKGGVTGPGLAFAAHGLLAVWDGPSVVRLWEPERAGGGRPGGGSGRWRALPFIEARGDFQTNPALALSPDGRLLAYTAGKVVQVRRLDDGRETALKGRLTVVEGVAFSPDGRTVATAGDDETVGLWDVATGRRRSSLLGSAESLIPVAFSPDGQLVAGGGWDSTVRLWDARTGRLLATLLGHDGPVTRLAVSPDSKIVASSGLDGTVRLWSTAARGADVVLPGQERMIGVGSLAFSRDGRWLATGAADGIARLWDLRTHRHPRLFQVDPSSTGGVTVALSPDGAILVAGLASLFAPGFGGGVSAWNVGTGARIFHRDTGLFTLAFSPDARHLALSTQRGDGRAVELWDIHRGSRLATLPSGVDRVLALAFSPDGRILAGGSKEGRVRLWDVARQRLLGPPFGRYSWIWGLAFSPDGRTLALGAMDGMVHLWEQERSDARGGWQELLPPIRPHGAPAIALDFSRDGRTLAMANQTRAVLLWNVETRLQVATLTGHEAEASSVAFSPDGNTLATGANDVRLWRAPPLTAIEPPQGTRQAARAKG